jgi:anthranilate synthase component 2
MKRALFVDFEDSFTYNVVQELIEAGLSVEVTKWSEVHTVTDHELLVLGPGPGHPDDYKDLFPFIRSWLDCGKKIFGVCLGHQILLRIKGFEIRRSHHPLHGQKTLIKLTTSWQEYLKLPENIWVQRYNSLAVEERLSTGGIDIISLDGEIMLAKGFKFLSYQFHPESVGTNCRQSFFRPILTDLL